MSFARTLFALTAPVLMLALSACATSFNANVSRYQSMPAPDGQSFSIQTSNPKLQGGLEFAQYAGLVRDALIAKGYHASETPQAATLVVNLDYGVDDGQPQTVTRHGRGYMGWGRYGWRQPYYWGWYDPFWYDPWDYPEVDSYTLYTSHLDMTINRTSDGERVFEGKAKARSTSDSLPKLVPNLVAAMFTNFPGRSGEEVKITVAPEPKK